jgi:glycosyltransferase involved in cell wall biosynthesis
MAALAHGLPVLTTEGVHTEAVWRESGAVALVPTDDVQALVNQTRRLLADDQQRCALGEAGRRLYQAQFTPERVAAALRSEAADGPASLDWVTCE